MIIGRISRKLIRSFQISDTEILIIAWIWLTAKTLIRKLIKAAEIPDTDCELIIMGWALFWAGIPITVATAIFIFIAL